MPPAVSAEVPKLEAMPSMSSCPRRKPGMCGLAAGTSGSHASAVRRTGSPPPFADRGAQPEIAVGPGRRPSFEIESCHSRRQAHSRDLELGGGRARDRDLDGIRRRSLNEEEATAGSRRAPAFRGPRHQDATRPRSSEFPVLDRGSHVERPVHCPSRLRRGRIQTAHEKRHRPAAIELGEGAPGRLLQVRDPAEPRLDQRGQQLWPILVHTPAQKQVGAPPIAMAAKQIGGVVVFHHKLVTFGPRQERADAIVDVRSGKAMQVLGQMRQGLIQPSLLLDRDPPRPGELTRLSAEDHCVHVLVSQDGPKVGTGHESCAQIHHVAAVAERRRERGIEVRHSHEPVHGMAAVAQTVQPAREQDRETAISIDVAGQPDRASGDGNDPVVKRRHQILQQLGIHSADILRGHVDLNPFAHRAEDPPDGQVVARTGNVAIANHQREVTLTWRHSAGRLLDRLRIVRPEPRRTIGGCLLQLRNPRIRRRRRLQPDRKRAGGPGERRDDHQRLGS